MLEGIKVVEMASIAAGPSAAAILAEWGAEVIKVEPLEGDAGRHTLTGLGVQDLTDINPEFELHNRGKRSIAVDLRRPEAHAVVLELISGTDVFITNMQPHKLEQRGLDWERMRTLNPRLVYASISGYGLRGADRELPGIDHTAFWSRSGLAGLMAVKGSEPTPIRMAVGDRMTGLALVSGILAATIGAQKTGKGKLVEVSLLRTGVYALGTDLGLQMVRGRVGSNKPRHENVNPYFGFYPTRDNRWLAVQLGRADSLPEVLGHPELKDDPRFATPQSRREHAREVVDIIDNITRERTLAEWCEHLKGHDFPWAPVNSPADAIADPQVEAAGAFVDVPRRGGEGTFRALAMPVGFRDADGQPDGLPRAQAPRIGENTDEILRALGRGAEEIAALRKAGAVR